MDCQKLLQDRCRICLEGNVELDWNDYLHEDMTYKDCYYKYTKLDCIDGDDLYLSTMLCRDCSNSLEHINAFISKAIEHHNFLREHIENDSDKKTSFETIFVLDSDIKLDIKDIPMNEEPKESDNWNLPEDTAITKKQPKTLRKRKVAKRINKQDNIESDSNELQKDIKITKKTLGNSRPWEIPTCCSICSKVLCSKYSAIKHEQIHLKDRERNETCKECGMKFYSKSTLSLHMRTHAQNRGKDRKCEFCDKAFYNMGALNIHRRKHLGQMLPCNLCSKEYYRQVDLDKHMISHSATRIDGELKPNKKYFVCCEVCGENVRSTQYKSHAAKHMNEPLTKCAICNKEYFSRDSCISHLKKFHKKGNGERSKFVITYKNSRYTNLFLQQNVGKIFTKE